MKICPKDNLQFSDVMNYCPQCGTKLRDVNPETDRIVGDNYRIGEELGEGWVGKVFRTTHVMIGKQVALKAVAVDQELTDDQVQLFRDWARDMAGLDHRHVAVIHDVWLTDRKIIYIASELVKGRNLRDLLNEMGHFGARQLLPIIRQISQAVSYAHGMHIVHGDIKPENIMLNKVEGRDIQVKLLDFGMSRLAALTGDSRFRYSSGMYDVIGIPEYISPEQIKGHELDPRSDIYMLGLVMYEMVTGQSPFRGSNIEELYEAHLREIPPSPRELKPRLNIPKFIDRAIMKTLEKNRKKRQQSIDDLLDELDGELGADEMDTSTSGVEVGVSSKFWKKMQKIVRKPRTQIAEPEDAESVPPEDGVQDDAPIKSGDASVTEADIPVELSPLENLEMKLTLVRDDKDLASYTVSSLPLTIGRSKSADIRIKEDIGVSRRHATIFMKDKDIYVFDRNSSNGLFSKGHRIRNKKLDDGDSFSLGGTEVVVELKKK